MGYLLSGGVIQDCDGKGSNIGTQNVLNEHGNGISEGAMYKLYKKQAGTLKNRFSLRGLEGN